MIRVTADQGVIDKYTGLSLLDSGRAARSLRMGRGNVVLNALLRLLDLRDQVVEIGGAVDEVDLVGVHDEEGRLFVVVEEEFLGWFVEVLRDGGVKIMFFTLKNVFIIQGSFFICS